ncbi:homoserine O-acetyltransferase [Phormidium sp. FACHB-592]|uniref:Homoserine O-acetyltransferase n=1 Tax=Stenomitos frigidus AS-A4 TaxID=2933935 RepID=A0ABV0KTQ2_9CYAN|nr:homoserine O-acetyltransferase [Phormidium sp. FACHB-592]MBD2075233.1 homoserine O-acetyltransferase [Phormidium sp. FACHB-592]
MSDRPFVSPQTQYYTLTEPFCLESGVVLMAVQIAYRTWGQLNAKRDNAILVCHALTGGADADDWWAPLFGADQTFDPQTDFILCSNVLGSCYGTTGATSFNPATDKPYGAAFPSITIRDMVQLQAVLLQALSVNQIKFVIGGSMGGMQALEWALLYPDWVKAIALIGVSGKHSAWCIGISEAQRQAIYADPNWQGGRYLPDQAPNAGLAAARMMAMLTYRSWASFEAKFSRQQQDDSFDRPYKIVHYLRHQGQKLVERFDANTYITLTHAMDTHDVARGRGDYTTVLSRVQQPALVVAIDSDMLYPPVEQQALATHLPNAQFTWLHSPHGHDAFLIDMEALNQLIINFRHQIEAGNNAAESTACSV